MLSSRVPAMLSRVNLRALSTARINYQSTSAPQQQQQQQQQKHDSNTNSQQQQPRPLKSSMWLVVALTTGAASFYYLAYGRTKDRPRGAAAHRRADLPSISKKEVEKRGLYIYGKGVYDLEAYAKNDHPGGEKTIVELKGHSFQKAWASDAMKFHLKPEILDQLESMRVGNVDKWGPKWGPGKFKEGGFEGPACFAPKVNAKDYRLEVAVADGESLRALTLDELRGLKKHTIKSKIHCKSDDPAKREVEVEWTGTGLVNVLKELKINKDDYELVRLECLDRPSKPDKPRGATLPLNRILGEPVLHVLLAYERDGKELEPQQGYPLRVVIPQAPGAQNVKWLHRIVLVKKANN